jgi:hypothetical protein
MGRLSQSSWSSAAEGPSPRPSVPWHLVHSTSVYHLAPRFTESMVRGGSGGIGIGTAVSVANRGESVWTSLDLAGRSR